MRGCGGARGMQTPPSPPRVLHLAPTWGAKREGSGVARMDIQ